MLGIDVFVYYVFAYLYQLVSTYMLYISAAIIGLGAPVIWTAQVLTSLVYYNVYHLNILCFATCLMDGAGQLLGHLQRP